MIFWQRKVGLILSLLLLTTLTGCVPKNPFARISPEESPLLDFAQIYSRFNLNVKTIQRLDTDGDGVSEWVVFYRFDLPPSESGRERFAPIAGLVYDATDCRPPSILPYPLDPGDRNYLGTDTVSAEATNLLGADDSVPEVVARTTTNGIVTALSVFQWFDVTQNPCQPRYAGQQGYRLMGTFRGDAGVEIGANGAIIVKQLAAFDRSQFAYRRVYVPQDRNGGAEGYMKEGGRELADPTSESITFAFGPPASPRDSPYPEKSILAFYLALGKDNDGARTFLAIDADPSVTQTNFGLGTPLDEVDHVVVKGIEYAPDLDLEQEHEPVQVVARVVTVRKNGDSDPMREVRWLLKGVPIPERTDCEWRLSKLISTKPWNP